MDDRINELNNKLNEIGLEKNKSVIETLKKLKKMMISFSDERDWRNFSQKTSMNSSEQKTVEDAANLIYKSLDKYFKRDA